MVTTTEQRTPHALQAGASTTGLWLTHRAIALATAVVPILLLPIAGRHLTWHGEIPLPDVTLAIGILVTYAVLLTAGATRRGISSALDMRIPGGMVASSSATRVPGVIAALVIQIGQVVAAFYAATHAAGDHGATALFLMLAGVIGVAQFLKVAAGIVVRRRSGWRESLAVTFISTQLPAMVVLFSIGRFLAPRGELSAPEMAGFLLAMFVVAYIAIELIRFVARESRSAGGVRDLAEAVSDGVLSRTNAAPTLSDRSRGTRIALVAIYVVPGVLAMTWLALVVLS